MGGVERYVRICGKYFASILLLWTSLYRVRAPRIFVFEHPIYCKTNIWVLTIFCKPDIFVKMPPPCMSRMRGQ